MQTDYDYVIAAITNKDNKYFHYPAIKKLISIWAIKWEHQSKGRYFGVYLHSLNTTLKRSSIMPQRFDCLAALQNK